MDRTTSHDQRAALWQRLLNGRPIPPRHLQRQNREPIDVRVRLVWERDGEEWVDTVALEWTRELVRVRIRDRRHPGAGGWVAAGTCAGGDCGAFPECRGA